MPSRLQSTNEKLQEALANHRDETEGHVERLEKVFEAIGKKPRGKTCDAILGIIAEGQEIIDEVGGMRKSRAIGATRDRSCRAWATRSAQLHLLARAEI
jgi:ferritin-like metal-binding protein YciE